MDIRVTVNIKLFLERAQAKVKKPTPRHPHELYFWNILVLSQLLNNPEVTELIGTCLHMQPTRHFNMRIA